MILDPRQQVSALDPYGLDDLRRGLLALFLLLGRGALLVDDEFGILLSGLDLGLDLKVAAVEGVKEVANIGAELLGKGLGALGLEVEEGLKEIPKRTKWCDFVMRTESILP